MSNYKDLLILIPILTSLVSIFISIYLLYLNIKQYNEKKREKISKFTKEIEKYWVIDIMNPPKQPHNGMSPVEIFNLANTLNIKINHFLFDLYNFYYISRYRIKCLLCASEITFYGIQWNDFSDIKLDLFSFKNRQIQLDIDTKQRVIKKINDINRILELSPKLRQYSLGPPMLQIICWSCLDSSEYILEYLELKYFKKNNPSTITTWFLHKNIRKYTKTKHKQKNKILSKKI